MIDLDELLGISAPHAADHLRCPLCGKVSPAERFDPDVVEHHVLERLERRSVGRPRGFEWEHDLAPTRDQWVALQRALWTALRRVQAAAVQAGAEEVGDDDVPLADVW